MILATRGSALALAQAELVKKKLEDAGETVTILPVVTKGDRDRNRPLTEIGGDGLFIREIERVLLRGEADLAVHSAKDLPYALAEGIMIGGVPEAGDPRDCLVTREELCRVHLVATGSPRRIEEYRRLDPAAEFTGIRGNVNTRIQRLREGRADALILAKAGLERLMPDLSGLSVRCFAPDEMIPAPCQGILAAECRENDGRTRAILEAITDREATRRFETERYLFQRLQADCAMPVGVYAEFRGEKLILRVRFGARRIVKQGLAEDRIALCEEILA